MSTTVGTVIIDVKADTAKLVSGMNKAEKTVKNSVNNIKKAIVSMAAAYAGIQGVKAFSGMISDSLDAADATGKLAQKLGLTTDALSEFQYAAGFAAVSNSELSAGLSALVRRMNNFQKDGGGAAKKAFTELGISAEYARKHFTSTDVAFVEILKRLEKMPDGFKKTAVAQDIFSKSASGILRITATDLKKFSEEAKAIGISISQSTYEMAAAYHDEMDRVEARFTGLGYKIAKDLLPSITNAATEMTKILDGESKYNKTIDDLTTMAEVLGVAAIATKGYLTVTSLATTANLAFSGSFGALNRAIILTTVSTKALALATKSIPYVAAAAGLYTMYELIKASSDGMSIAERSMRDYADSINSATTATIDFELVKLRKKQNEVNQSMNDEASNSYGLSISPHYEKLANDATLLAEKINILMKKKKELLTVEKELSSEEESKNGIKDSKSEEISLDKQILLNKRLNDVYLTATGTKYDVFLNNVSNKMVEMAKNTSLTTEELMKYYDALMKDAPKSEEKTPTDTTSTSSSAWQKYYETLGDYETVWLIKQGVLAQEYQDLSKEQYAVIYKNAKTKYFDKINEMQINLGIKGIDEAYAPMEEMLESQIALTDSTNNWNTSLQGLGGTIATVGEAFTKMQSDSLNGTLAQTKLDKRYEKDKLKATKGTTKRFKLDKKYQQDSDKIKNKSFKNELDGYADLAGASKSLFSEKTVAYKALNGIETAMHAAKLVMMVTETAAELATVAPHVAAEGTKSTASGITAIISSMAGLPFPLNMVAFAATAAVVAAILGGSSGGGGSSTSSISQAEMDTQAVEAEYNPVIDRLDRQIELLEAIDRNGSASALGVQLAGTTFDRDYQLFVIDSMEDMNLKLKSRWGTQQGTVNSRSATEQSVEEALGFNLADSIGDYTTLNRDVLRESTNFMQLLEGFNDGDMPSDWWVILDKGWKEAGIKPFEMAQRKILDFTNDFQALLSDFTLSLIDTMSELKEASDTFKDIYDDITDTTFYETQKLQAAYADVERLSNGASLSDFLASEIGNIQKLQNFLTDDKINTLLLEDPTKLQEQLDIVKELEAETGLTFENGARDALDYLESIQLVSDAMVTSRENITDFADSFKTDEQLVQDKAAKLGISTLATTPDELMNLFEILSGGIGGLTDGELDFLEANKDLLESFDDIIDKYDESIDTLTSVVDSLQGTIDKLYNSALGSSYTMQQYNDAMSSALNASLSDASAYQELVNDAINKSSVLFDSNNYQTSRDQQFAQLIAANQFGDMQEVTLTQIDYLKYIEENTRESNAHLIDMLQALSNDMSMQYASSNTSVVNDTYNAILGRDADTAGNNYWSNELSSGSIASNNIGIAVGVAGVENNEISRADYVTDLYTAGLGRTPTSAEVDYWANDSSTPTSDLASIFKELDPKFTAFADGGIVTKPTLGLIGEAGYNEAIIPLKDSSDPLQTKELVASINNLTLIVEQQANEIREIRKLNEDQHNTLLDIEEQGVA